MGALWGLCVRVFFFVTMNPDSSQTLVAILKAGRQFWASTLHVLGWTALLPNPKLWRATSTVQEQPTRPNPRSFFNGRELIWGSTNGATPHSTNGLTLSRYSGTKPLNYIIAELGWCFCRFRATILSLLAWTDPSDTAHSLASDFASGGHNGKLLSPRLWTWIGTQPRKQPRAPTVDNPISCCCLTELNNSIEVKSWESNINGFHVLRRPQATIVAQPNLVNVYTF